ncbi:MAG: 5'-deoxyadenosine deaminase [Candidatus Sericytochromatia bacterium]|nr:5'-deoxyadenosine deaminase [Candidatus Sericytochromatia bacterium]
MSSGVGARPAKLHLRGGRIVTMNARRDVIQADMTITDGVITAIGPDLPIPAGATLIDASRMTLIPGLVQIHIHLCQTLFRGLADDLLLLDWLKQRLWPLEGAHDGDSLATSANLGLAELIRGGTTTIVDMATVHHTERVFQAIADSGMRAISGKCMMDVGDGVPETLMETTESSLAESIKLLDAWDGFDQGRIRYAFTPRFAVSCTDGLMRQVAKIAAERGTYVHTHASENLDEIALVERERGMRNVVYFESIGMTGPHLILAHCVWLDAEEMAILARTGTRVAHCPSSNLKLGSGIAPVPEMLAKGISVSFGADGAPCNNNLDGFQEMRLASLIQKPVHGPTAMPAALTFELATLGGARAIGQDDRIGSLEVGKRADVVIIDLTGLHTAPATETNVYSQLVYAARSTDVRVTIVDGRILFQDGKVQTIDEAAVLADVPKALARVLQRSGVDEIPLGMASPVAIT